MRRFSGRGEVTVPYSIKKVSGGFKVSSDHGTHFSKKPQSKEKAKAQLRAIAANTHGAEFHHGATAHR